MNDFFQYLRKPDLYSVYHGPQGIREIATRIHHATLLLAKGLRESGNDVQTDMFFDTIKVAPRLDISEIKIRAAELKMNFRYFPDETVGVSLDETIDRTDVRDILWVFGTPKSLNQVQMWTNISFQFLKKSSHPIRQVMIFN